MRTDEVLPLDLTWQPDGHVTEVALAMVADGEQALLADGVADHLGACEACGARLGASALISLRVTEELPAIAARHALAEARTEIAAAAPAPLSLAPRIVRPAPQPATRPLPVRALAAALVVAVIGAIPTLVVGLPKLPDTLRSVVKMLLVIGRSVAALIQGAVSGEAGAAPALTWVAAALFLTTGLSVARSMSRKHSFQGGVG